LQALLIIYLNIEIKTRILFCKGALGADTFPNLRGRAVARLGTTCKVDMLEAVAVERGRLLSHQFLFVHTLSSFRTGPTSGTDKATSVNSTAPKRGSLTTAADSSYGEKPVVSKTSRFKMLAYSILYFGLFARHLAYFLKRLVLKQQVFPRIDSEVCKEVHLTTGRLTTK